MAKFPIDLTYYDRTIKIVRENNGFPTFPTDEFLGLMKCDDQSFYYIKTKKNGHYLELDEVGKTYFWVTCHMIIPEYFTKMDIDVHTPDHGEPFITYLDEGEKMSRTYNGLFALAINQRLSNRIKAHELEILLRTGQNGCAIPPFSEDSSNNMDQLVFKFRKHFFIPVILSNGVIVYYAFEKEDTIGEWVKKAADAAHEYTVAVESPVYYDNAFGIFITKNAQLIQQPKF